MLDFLRIACAVPAVQVGDTVENAKGICAYMEQADKENVDLIVFPELAITGYSCGDLFFQEILHNGVKLALKQILACAEKLPKLTAVVGFPLKVNTRLYNCAGVISDGKLQAIVPKTYLTGAEKRFFTAGKEWNTVSVAAAALGLAGEDIPVGQRLFAMGDVVLGVEICEDFMTPTPVSSELAVGGAEVIVNLSASPESVGKRDFRRDLVKHQSSACSCVYAFCSAGCTESTANQVFAGQSIIAENGTLLAENENPVSTDYLLVTDCDLGRIRAQRTKSQYFGSGKELPVTAIPANTRSDGRKYPLNPLPFIPPDRQTRKMHCLEIFQIQVAGLKRRLQFIDANAVIGISGGLDSTLALLVAVEAMRQLNRPMTDVHGVTMPCFGTSDRTYRNAWELMKRLGITGKEIPIRDAVNQHFLDIGHDNSVHNATYENSQARERTQILMDYAGMVSGIVVGTGDLSELALGWCTYNGDHMSMYGVNGDIPKTLIRWIIDAVAELSAFAPVKDVLLDVLDTPISPELLPPDASGKISQQTEDLVGPYALHDFFLYHVLHFGFAPEKIYTLACRAFNKDFDSETVKKWLKIFYRRFFSQQFKRNCMPDGVKVLTVGFAPGNDWVMPSDATATLWLQNLEDL